MNEILEWGATSNILAPPKFKKREAPLQIYWPLLRNKPCLNSTASYIRQHTLNQ